jgi:GT2 family glycosyltransferase
VRAVIVSYADAAATANAARSLQQQTVPLAEVVVVNNLPGADLAELPEGVRLIEPATNLGYPGGANLGAAGAQTDWIFFLNPDAVAQPDCLERLLEAGTDDRVGAVGAQVLLPSGLVNAGDNPLHLNGVSWAGRYGEQAERGAPRDAAVVSGAATLVRTAAWDALGGMNAEYFLYHDDVELSLRLWISGWRVVFQPAALVEHYYEFEKGNGKWFYLERNRAWTVLSVYGTRTLLLLAPLLLATELAVFARAVGEGWWKEKLRAWAAVVGSLSVIGLRRGSVQAQRQVPDLAWLDLTTGEFETPLAQSRAASAIRPALALYRRVVVNAAT